MAADRRIKALARKEQERFARWKAARDLEAEVVAVEESASR